MWIIEFCKKRLHTKWIHIYRGSSTNSTREIFQNVKDRTDHHNLFNFLFHCSVHSEQELRDDPHVNAFKKSLAVTFNPYRFKKGTQHLIFTTFNK